MSIDHLYIDVVVTLHQESDSCQYVPDDIDEPAQKMTIKLVDAGGGLYPVFTTSRWAVNKNEMIKISRAMNKVVKILGGLNGEDRPISDWARGCYRRIATAYGWILRRIRGGAQQSNSGHISF